MPAIRFNKFIGIVTRFGRGSRPEGSLDDCKNLQLGQTLNKMTLRPGYTADITSAPVDLSGTKTATAIQFPRGTFPATESPASKNIMPLCVTISGVNYYFQKPFWHLNNATLSENATRHLDWLWIGENTTTTINGAPSGSTLVLTAGSATNDYYNGWIIYNSTRTEYIFVTDYVGSTKTITSNFNIPTDWATTDSVTLYRHFHDNPTFTPNWTDPACVKTGNDFILSGGQGSTVGYKPIWSGQINATWFPSHSNSFSYNQTYCTEAELKSTAGYTLGALSEQVATDDLETDKTYYLGIVFETHDGQLSDLIIRATNYFYPTVTGRRVDENLIVDPARINKRFKTVHWFAAQRDGNVSTTPLYKEYFLVASWDMTNATAYTDWTATASGATPGSFNRTLELYGSTWNTRGTALNTFLGHERPARTTVSFSNGVVAAGRLIVGKYYDYSASLNYNDQINFSPIAQGVPQYNKLLDLDDQLQSTVDAGDPSTLTGLAVDQSTLLITKTRGIFSVNLTDDPSTWILNRVSGDDGCDATDSIAVTPFGIVFAQSGNGVFLFRNDRLIEISELFRTTFRNITGTYVTSWRGWYDPNFKAYRLMITTDGSTRTTFYEYIFGLPEATSFTKHVATNGVFHLLTRSDGRIYFTVGSTTSYYWDKDSEDDAGTAIPPYFDTGDYVPNEHSLALFDGFDLSVDPGTGTPAGTLTCTVKVDGSSIGSFTALTRTNTRFTSGLPIVGRLGKRVSFQFNTADATFGTGDGTSYTIHGFEIPYEIVQFAGDLVQSL